MTAAAQANQNAIQIDHFADDVRKVIVTAQALADERHHKEIQPLHLLASAMKNPAVLKTFKTLSLSERGVIDMIEVGLSDIASNTKSDESYLSLALEKFFTNLEKDSSTSDLVHIDKFFAALTSKSYKQNYNIFHNLEIDMEAFNAALLTVRKAGFSQMSNETLLRMEEFIGKRVIGQKDAVHAVSRVVRRGKVGLNDAGKPIGSLLFLGPSGVGKTELAKALTELLNGDEKKLVRLDMSEFGEKHMAQRLIGSPPGYVDSGNGGYLTEAVKKDPNAVLLFDEIEKAHPDVFNLLLQVLDDGRLTDGRGQTTDFSNTIIIMTSNIGSRKIIDFTGEGMQNEDGRMALKEMLHHEMMAFLRPELINRIDDIIIFEPLSKLEISQIVEIQLRAVQKLLAPKDLKISFNDAAKAAIAEMGYDPLFGSRPLKRVILKYVKDPLAEKLIAGAYLPGSEIKVSYNGESFQLN